MIEEGTTGRLDFGGLRRAIERRDPETRLGFYADDAEVLISNADAPQCPPFELHGKAEIARYLWAVCDQKTRHRVELESSGEERVEFGETCQYPDGIGVVVNTTLELRDGRILRQVDVVSREEAREAGEGGGNREEEEAVS